MSKAIVTTAKEVQSMTFSNLKKEQVQQMQILLTDNEMTCIGNQLMYPRLRDMTKDDQHDAIVDLVSEIKLLTGATICEKAMLEKQIKMIHRFIASGFGSLTRQEIVHAFYLNNQGELDAEIYKHYGKELNAEFLGDVLRAYVKWKKHLAKEKGAKFYCILQPAPRPEKQDVDYEIWKEIVQIDYNDFLHNSSGGLSVWHARKYYTLRRDGLLPYKGVAGWIYFVKQAMMIGRGGTNIPAGANMKEFKITTVKQLRDLFKTSDGFHACVDIARQLAVGHAFGALAACGIRKIWSEVKTNRK